MRVTIFCCEPDEEAVFREKSPDYGIEPVITAAPVSESTIALAEGSRSISVGHKTPITNAHLEALSALGVQYISTRSIGYNHIDVAFAQSLGITVKNETIELAAAPSDMRWATAMAGFGMMLRASPHRGQLTWQQVRTMAKGALGTDSEGYRAQALQLIERASKLTR